MSVNEPVVVTQEAPVSWLDPRGLLRTGLKTFQATMFGNFADKREVIAALHPEDTRVASPAIDYSGHDQIYFDFIADTGDGWNATYSIACASTDALLTLQPANASGKPENLPRADFTVLGGDEVYPTASADVYKNRLEDPFFCALADGKDRRPVYALPGNHDWYDGLSSFLRLFCQKDRRVGPWVATQTRSYFAIKLPHNWWIWGVDVQLKSDIDPPQIEYFKHYAGFLQPNDKVILCTPEPTWVEAGVVKDAQARQEFSKTHDNMTQLADLVLERQASIRMRIAGDFHHYARYTGEKDGAQLITCGGGGAFLHPTHGLPTYLDLAGEKSFRQNYARSEANIYPSTSVSESLRWGAFKLIKKNPGFAAALGGIYAAYVWALESASDVRGGNATEDKGLTEIFKSYSGGNVCDALINALSSVWYVIAHAPACLLLSVGLIYGAYAFSMNFRRKNYPKAGPAIGGLLHGVIHLLAAILLMWGASVMTGTIDGWWNNRFWHFVWNSALPVYLAVGFAGAFIGSMIMSIYLIAANALYGGHDQEVLSSQAIEDYKCFARIHIAKGGATLYPIKVNTAKSWKPAAGATVKKEYRTRVYARTFEMDVDPAVRRIFEPETDLAPALIEPPVKF